MHLMHMVKGEKTNPVTNRHCKIWGDYPPLHFYFGLTQNVNSLFIGMYHNVYVVDKKGDVAEQYRPHWYRVRLVEWGQRVRERSDRTGCDNVVVCSGIKAVWQGSETSVPICRHICM